MSDYDYLNARVRGMSTDLLSREFYEQVLDAFTDTILVDALLDSAYAGCVEQARQRHSALPPAKVAESAAWAHASLTFSRLLGAAPPEPRRLLGLQLNRWDVANVVTLVRARHAGAEPHEALASVLPIGEIEEAQLAELAAEPDLEGLADALTGWKHAVGFELRRAIRECPRREDVRALESCLYHVYFDWALAQLRPDDPHQALVRASIQRHIDLLNVVTILGAIRGRPAEGVLSHGDLFERGTFDEKLLEELAHCEALEDAFEVLASTWLGPGVEKGILTYGQSQDLGVMERFLEAVMIEQACRLFRQDMLSAAVPLGFVWRKYSECVNLRLLARGILFRMPPNAVRLELVLV